VLHVQGDGQVEDELRRAEGDGKVAKGHTKKNIKQIKKQRWKKSLHDIASLVLFLPIVFSLS
jgi:hypothetical protein